MKRMLARVSTPAGSEQHKHCTTLQVQQLRHTARALIVGDNSNSHTAQAAATQSPEHDVIQGCY